MAETGNAAPPPATRAFEEPKQGEEAGPTGSVVDVVTGLPVSGLKLYLSEEPSAVTTDDEGLFELPVLPPGAYSILIQDDFIFMANGQRSVSFAIEMGADLPEVEVDVIYGGVIEGTVWLDGTPVVGTQVALYYPDGDSGSPHSETGQATLTEDDGYFSFKTLVPGEAQIQAYLQLDMGRETIRTQLAIIEAGAGTNVDIDFNKSLEGQLIYGDLPVQRAFGQAVPTVADA
ncbi:MAG: carboxypeptidase-like regulatory domain-containing protein [Candidatus Hydrogenedentes bacterium]|nr:carboxypeptidase-like regulatory domain-containing protein [Candidatus Hydrogenedentota bacterium]